MWSVNMRVAVSNKRRRLPPLLVRQTQEQLAQNLLVGTAGEIVDKLQQYAELGIHEINLNMNIGATPVETLASIERFATEVIPYFTNTSEAAVSRR
jgi:alkanesulfonate monooxygenase SsuD/methylene tetrahydromethanopterin reductase-like flavin-dependent oxidoreductase (luciferase family)